MKLICVSILLVLLSITAFAQCPNGSPESQNTCDCSCFLAPPLNGAGAFGCYFWGIGCCNPQMIACVQGELVKRPTLKPGEFQICATKAIVKQDDLIPFRADVVKLTPDQVRMLRAAMKQAVYAGADLRMAPVLYDPEPTLTAASRLALAEYYVTHAIDLSDPISIIAVRSVQAAKKHR
jgi:hypothetical protein